MTPKEKAEELIDKFKPLCVNVKHIGILDGLATVMNDDFINLIASKQCALIAVDEILNSRPLEPNHADWDDCGATHKYWYDAQKEEALKYWQEVKQEIDKL
jgi:hypothetical protein